MSEVHSTSTPRLSDISSLDSAQDTLEQSMLSPGFANSLNMPKKPILNHSSTYHGSPSFGTEDLRRSPDSDVLASSDEDVDHNPNYLPGNITNRNIENISSLSSRRPSYAAEFSSRQRNLASLGNGSQPSVPSTDNNAWSNTTAQDRKNSLNLTWTRGSIWNPDSPTKLQSKGLSGSNNGTNGSLTHLFMGNESLISPTGNASNNKQVDPQGSSNPQPRNHRSLSFSVGQRELEELQRPRLSPPAHSSGARMPGLQHRPSRPSLLSEEQFANGGPLHSVFENTDTNEDVIKDLLYNDGGIGQSQGALSRVQFNSLRLKSRSASATVLPTRNKSIGASMFPGRLESDTIEEYEDMLGNEVDLDSFDGRGPISRAAILEQSRRYSEAPKSSFAENHRLETLKRQWYNAGGSFSNVEENGSQSRRHSFAGPLAPGALGNDFLNGGLTGIYNSQRSNSPPSYDDPTGLANNMARVNLEGYMLDDPQNRQSLSVSSPYASQLLQYSQLGKGIPQMPSANLDSQRGTVPPHASQPVRGQQLLYLVSFKACRADIFYVQDGTGLRVKNGDLVIVEADRGTDLGTVTGEDVTWQQAKDLKEQAAQQHFEWLMMFSTRRPGGAVTTNGIGPTPILVNGQTASAAGLGIGDQHLQPGQEAATAELKPKMIKRLAQVHEIQTLRDKEANEAKAKRVCQQKVLEHRLPMEILDAEFQMDWKKLTFYYYADSYINFNSLVTDLFKIYKTRIWMSAMNPASFAHSGPFPLGFGAGNPASSNLYNPMSDHILDPQATLLAMQQQYPGSQQFANYPSSVPRTLLAGIQSSFVPQQLTSHQIQPQLYTMRQVPQSLVSHQDYSHLSHQQNTYNSSGYSGTSGTSNSTSNLPVGQQSRGQ